MRLKVKHIRKQIKNLPDDAYFEINISDGNVNNRMVSEDIVRTNEVEFGTWKDKKKEGFYINIPYWKGNYCV